MQNDTGESGSESSRGAPGRRTEESMRISGINGAGISAMMGAAAGGAQADPEIRQLQSQRENLQQQLKDLASKREMPEEMKRKKRQELQQQISDLEVQIRQRQIEVKREAAMQQQETKGNGGGMDELLGNGPDTGKNRNKGTGMSAGSMAALISADTAMQQADIHGSTAQHMEGRAGVLEAEINLDSMSAQGASESKKEALAEAQAKADEAVSAQMGALAQANEAAQRAGEAEESTDDLRGAADKDEDKDKDPAGERAGEIEGTGSAAASAAKAEDTAADDLPDTQRQGGADDRSGQTIDIRL